MPCCFYHRDKPTIISLFIRKEIEMQGNVWDVVSHWSKASVPSASGNKLVMVKLKTLVKGRHHV
ncbi:MAG: hypothetical protein BM561_02755 [Vibrio sp. MedPE-SWchi]|nr:MAG: hypothetical protein BM561_02755 [Vibrio sp. MedPE-SWchi]